MYHRSLAQNAAASANDAAKHPCASDAPAVAVVHAPATTAFTWNANIPTWYASIPPTTGVAVAVAARAFVTSSLDARKDASATRLSNH